MRCFTVFCALTALAFCISVANADPLPTEPTTAIPLDSERAFIFSCGEEQIKVLIDPESRDGGSDRLTVACQHFTRKDGETAMSLAEERLAIFYCATPDERVFPLYAEGAHDVKLVCLTRQRLQAVAPVRTAPSSSEQEGRPASGVRHLAQNKVYTVRCEANEELTSWRIQRKGRTYYQAGCETEDGRKNRERLIACQWPAYSVPENVLTPDDQNLARYLCLGPRATR